MHVVIHHQWGAHHRVCNTANDGRWADYQICLAPPGVHAAQLEDQHLGDVHQACLLGIIFPGVLYEELSAWSVTRVRCSAGLQLRSGQRLAP